MHGLAELLFLRKQGIKPSHIWIHALDHNASKIEIEREIEAIASGFKFTLLLDRTENPFRLDLTPLQGTIVHILGVSKSRCLETLVALKNHSSRTITAGPDWYIDTEESN